MRFLVRWPDGSRDDCYSPSLVVKDFLAPGTAYRLADFLARSRAALTIASDRVEARYGMPCSRALRQLADIEARCKAFADNPDAEIVCDSFRE
jgi:uncharacterized repeat protein (TIGR04042 family)